MALNLSKDIRSITDLKRHTKDILTQVQQTGRPVVLTTNGKADAVLMGVKTFEKHLRAANLAKLLQTGEQDISKGSVQAMEKFVKKFASARKI